jgi:hypothetical protein
LLTAFSNRLILGVSGPALTEDERKRADLQQKHADLQQKRAEEEKERADKALSDVEELRRRLRALGQDAST